MSSRLLLLVLCSIPLLGLAQIGGTSVYQFVNIPGSARLAALGGDVVSLKDSDPNMPGRNPAVLDSSMTDNLSINYINYFAGINMGYASFAKHSDKIGTWGAGLQYVNYGKFTRANAGGEQLGDFSAGEYALNFSYAIQRDSLFAYGINSRLLYSKLDAWWSMGMAFDLGMHYTSKQKAFTAGLVVRNLGLQFRTYSGNREALPIDIQLGATQRIKNAPFRISAVAKNLQQLNLTYPTDDNPEGAKALSLDNIFRHLGFGVEFLPTDNFWIALGYNHQRRAELATATRSGATGISGGFGFKVKKFRLAYSRSTYHVAGSTNQISVTTNIQQLKSRKG